MEVVLRPAGPDAYVLAGWPLFHNRIVEEYTVIRPESGPGLVAEVVGVAKHFDGLPR
jgi:hypothetical protein